IDVSLAVSPVRNAQDEIVGASKIARDITGRKRAEEQIRESEARLATQLAEAQLLQDVSGKLIQEGKSEALFDDILEAAVALMHSDAASMQMFYSEKGELRLLAWKGFHPTSAAFWEWVRIDSGSSCGEALRAGERIVVSDLDTCEFVVGTPDHDAYRRSDLRAVQSTPRISRSGRVLGMISTHWR